MADDFDEFDDIDAMMAGGDDFSMDMDESPDKPTSAVGQVGDGIMSSLDIDMTASKIKNSMLDELPGNLGDGVFKAESAIDSLTETFDKELKPFKRAASGTLGGLADVLPKGMSDSIKSLKSWIDGDDDGSSKEHELTEDEKIQEEVNGILVKSAIEEQVSARIANLQSKKDSELLGMIAEATTKTMIFTSEYNANYYKRSLELQLKQVMTSVKLYDLLRTDSDIRGKQLEAIVKNTALPDFAKSRASDMLKQIGIKGLGDMATNAFTKSDAIANVTKFGKEKIIDGMGKATDALGMGSMVTDTLKDQMEMGQGIIEILTTLATDTLVDKGVAKGTEYALKKLFETSGGVEVLGDYDRFVSDPQSALDKANKKHIENGGNEEDYKYKAMSLGQEAMGEMYRKNDVKISNITDMRESAMVDNKFKKSVDTVIPGFLAKILNELTTIRKSSSGMFPTSASSNSKVSSGNTSGGLGIQNNQSNNIPKLDDELVYDYDKGGFVSKLDVKKDFNEKIDKHVSTLATSIINSKADEYLVTDHLSIPERTEIALALSKHILAGKTVSPAYMRETGFLNYFKDNKELKKKVSKGLNLLEAPTTKTIFDNRTKLDNALNNIKKNNVSTFADVAQSADLNNTSDVLVDMGITDKDNANSITAKNVNDVMDKRISKGLSGKIDKSKLTLSEQALIDNTKKAHENLKEKSGIKDNRLRKSKDRTLKSLRDNDISIMAFNAGIDNSNLTEEKQVKFIEDGTKDLTPENKVAYISAFELGITQGKNEDNANKTFKEKKEALAKKTTDKITRVSKKMTDAERSSYKERVTSETTLEELKAIGSFNAGKFTGKGTDDEIAGIVHKNEFVLARPDIDNLINLVNSGDLPKLANFSTT
ncbi:MAG: hypothetical protein DRP47_09970, partial [Candidatus Zixiibacteriota bacterium]